MLSNSWFGLAIWWMYKWIYGSFPNPDLDARPTQRVAWVRQYDTWLAHSVVIIVDRSPFAIQRFLVDGGVGHTGRRSKNALRDKKRKAEWKEKKEQIRECENETYCLCRKYITENTANNIKRKYNWHLFWILEQVRNIQPSKSFPSVSSITNRTPYVKASLQQQLVRTDFSFGN